MEHWNNLKPDLKYSKEKRYEYIMNEIHELNTSLPLILKFKDLPHRLRNNDILRFNYIISSIYEAHSKEAPSFPWGRLSNSARMSKIKKYEYIIEVMSSFTVIDYIILEGDKGATVKLDDAEPSSVNEKETTTEYIFDNVSYGKHTYNVSKTDYSPLSKTINVTKIEAFKFSLTKQVKLIVNVLDINEQPIIGVNVTITNRNNTDEVYELVWQNDHYETTDTNIKTGKYKLSCKLDPFVPQDQFVNLTNDEETVNVAMEYIYFKCKHVNLKTKFNVLAIDGDELLPTEAVDGVFTKTLKEGIHKFDCRQTVDESVKTLQLEINASRNNSVLVFDLDGIEVHVKAHDQVTRNLLEGVTMRLNNRIPKYESDTYKFTCIHTEQEGHLVAKKEGYKDHDSSFAIMDDGSHIFNKEIDMEPNE